MYAALVTVQIEPSQAPAAAAALMDDILPKITSAPGFAAGYWLEPADGQGFSILLFDTEEQTRQAANSTTSWSAPEVSIEGVEIRPRSGLSSVASSQPRKCLRTDRACSAPSGQGADAAWATAFGPAVPNRAICIRSPDQLGPW